MNPKSPAFTYFIIYTMINDKFMLKNDINEV
jgi:hypothetical protein